MDAFGFAGSPGARRMSRTTLLSLLTEDQARGRVVLVVPPDAPASFVFADADHADGFIWRCGACGGILALFMAEHAAVANTAFCCRRCGALNDAAG